MEENYLNLLKRFGSIPKIPEDELATNGLKRFFNVRENTYNLVTEVEYNKNKKTCERILQLYKGYIFSDDLDRMKGFLRGAELVDSNFIAKIIRCAEDFKAVGIPPIFQSQFNFGRKVGESGKEEDGQVYRSFPAVDFIIQYATGSYTRNKVGEAISRKRKGQKVGFIPLKPTKVSDVKNFRRTAFTPDGKINSLLIRETLDYAKNNFKFQSDSTKQDLVLFDESIYVYLEGELGSLPTETPVYKEWDGNLEVILKPRWYLDYTPKESEKIAHAYFSSLLVKPKGKDRELFFQMAVLFPQMAKSKAGMLGISEFADPIELAKGVLERAVETNDFSQVPKKYLEEDPYRELFLPKVGEYYRKQLSDLINTDLKSIFVANKILIFNLRIKVHNTLHYIPYFKNILEECRYEALKQLSDEDFRLLFMTKHVNRYGKLISPNRDLHEEGDGEANDEISQFRKLLTKRYNRLSNPES